LFVYSLGLGVPFVLVAAGLGRVLVTFRWLMRHYTAVGALAGVSLVLIGLAVATGWWVRLVAPLTAARLDL
jgi:cytochrome c-type biogenesis protein